MRDYRAARADAPGVPDEGEAAAFLRLSDRTLQGRRGRIRKKIGPRRRDAVNVEAKIRAEMAAGTYVFPEDREKQIAEEAQTRMLFGDFAQDEFLPWSKSKHSDGHHRRQKLTRRKRIRPASLRSER